MARLKRTPVPLGHRNGNRPLQERRSSGPKLPERPPRRPDKRRHECRRLQLPPHPQVVEGIVVQNHRRNMGSDAAVLSAQNGFLTAYYRDAFGESPGEALRAAKEISE